MEGTGFSDAQAEISFNRRATGPRELGARRPLALRLNDMPEPNP